MKIARDLPVITLLTDFGTADYFVGAVKGAILSVNPNVVIVDITHEVPAQDIEELKELGVAEVFTPGAPTQKIIDFIEGAVTP